MPRVSVFFLLFDIVGALSSGKHIRGATTTPPQQRKRRRLTSDLRFSLINGDTSFFEPVKAGWENACEAAGVTCEYHETIGDCETFQKELLAEMVETAKGVLDGIAIAPCLPDDAASYVNTIVQETDVPIVTLDGDLPDSLRSAHVSTDNYFMGETMANALKQLRPEGGTFLLVSQVGTHLQLREAGFRDQIMSDNNKPGKARWYELNESPLYLVNKANMSEAQPVVDQNPTAIITFYQSAMRDPNWTDFVDFNSHRNITYVGTDDSDFQLEYLSHHYVNGLVGQLPYDMGKISLEVLRIKALLGTVEEFHATNLVMHTLVPLDLPDRDVDENLLGGLALVGYFFLGIVVLLASACIGWTLYHRKTIVVRAAQPFFLIMVAAGVIVLSSTLVPLSFDDDGKPESMSRLKSVGICMSIPWLACTGFTITFSALFSKTWRVNRLFHAQVRYGRIQVTTKDVIAPFVFLLTANFVVLTLWTIFDPLEYERVDDEGTDVWNRVISSYGVCRSNNVLPYLVPLSAINFSVLVIASLQAYQARNIQSEFAEANYIALAVSSATQAFMTGIPILVVTKDEPRAFYVMMALMIFLLSMAILLLIFVPKIRIQRSYSNLSERGQKKMMAESVQVSAGTFSGRAQNYASGSSSARSQRDSSSLHGSKPLHGSGSAMEFRPGILPSVHEDGNEEGSDNDDSMIVSHLSDENLVGRSTADSFSEASVFEAGSGLDCIETTSNQAVVDGEQTTSTPSATSSSDRLSESSSVERNHHLGDRSNSDESLREAAAPRTGNDST